MGGLVDCTGCRIQVFWSVRFSFVVILGVSFIDWACLDWKNMLFLRENLSLVIRVVLQLVLAVKVLTFILIVNVLLFGLLWSLVLAINQLVKVGYPFLSLVVSVGFLDLVTITSLLSKLGLSIFIWVVNLFSVFVVWICLLILLITLRVRFEGLVLDIFLHNATILILVAIAWLLVGLFCHQEVGKLVHGGNMPESTFGMIDFRWIVCHWGTGPFFVLNSLASLPPASARLNWGVSGSWMSSRGVRV